MVSVPWVTTTPVAPRSVADRISPATVRAISNVMSFDGSRRTSRTSISATRSSAGTAATKSAAESAGRASPLSAAGADEIVPPNDSTVTCGRRPNTAPLTVGARIPRRALSLEPWTTW